MQPAQGSIGTQGAPGMQVYPLPAVLPPAQMGEDPFLRDGAGQILDGGAGVLLLPRVDDGLRAQPAQHPPHPAELCRRNHEGHPASPPFGLHPEFAPFLGAIVHDNVAHNPGPEVGHRRASGTAIGQLLAANHIGPIILVPQSPTGAGRFRGAAFPRSCMIVRVIVG